ncbi:MAG: fatty acid desaturase [Flaviaesturariibacter sp.]|nr:fatty acid desaturase [Flaviaesturariibacter sp.]
MTTRVLKYGAPLLVYFGALVSFLSTGWVVYLPLVYAWAIVPVLELVLPADEANLSAAEEELARSSRWYDWMLYAIVPLQFGALALFLSSVAGGSGTTADIVGRTLVMGLLCGTFGINVGHELGHRAGRFERFLAKGLLLSSLYMHFYIEHNKGHHRHVATPQDPSSARLGEPVYLFWLRSITGSYRSAWSIATRDAERAGTGILGNEMVLFHLVQVSFLVLVYVAFGGWGLLLFALAALEGILLLETVNYIEHYGLRREATGPGTYERARAVHSWNSNHIIGRVMLFELSRHSDHHFLASRKYQVLRHHVDAPQMPTGYPGMMLLSLVPPAWFRVMDRRVERMKRGGEE